MCVCVCVLNLKCDTWQRGGWFGLEGERGGESVCVF